MSRNILIGRTDWVKDPAATFSGGLPYALPLTNLQDHNPQVVAEAAFTDPSAALFEVDLGYERWVGAFSLIGLRISRASTIRLLALNQASASVYDTGIVSGWPSGDLTGTDPWGNFTLTATYNPDLYVALGMPRIFVPAAPVRCRYIFVYPSDIAADNPVQIGCLNAWETWEPPRNLAYDWSPTIIDPSDVSRVPGGSAYINQRPKQRGIDFGFTYLPEDEFLARSYDLGLTRGTSTPTIVIPFPEDTENLEKMAVYGVFSQAPSFTNRFFQEYEHTFRIESLV